jgi:tetratricopeptide (TPR) repeat protein
MGRKDEAIEAFRAALRLNSRDQNNYRRLAAILRGQGRAKEASETLFTARALAPDDPQTKISYGEDLQSQGRQHAAAAALCKAYELQPDNIRFLVACGEAQFSDGRDAEGIALAKLVKIKISGRNLPAQFRQRAETLAVRSPSANPQAVAPPAPLGR